MQLSLPDEETTVRAASAGWLNTAVVVASTMMFTITGMHLLPQIAREGAVGQPALVPAFLLNIALLLLAWRRSVELKSTARERDKAQSHAYRLAYRDEATGLFNRRSLADRLERLAGTGESKLTLLLIDLDNFKKVNDLYGHATGDALLRRVASVLCELSPRTACCARLGGDEFAVLLQGDVAGHDPASELAARLLAEFDKPVQIGSTVTSIGASIGLATLGSSSEPAERLLRRSDIAMYEAKSQGRHRFVWFDADMERELELRNELEAEIRQSLLQGRFVPYFQPCIDLDTGEVQGFEVLARWNHPERGLLEPIEFIPVAEATGVISELSFDVMRQALIDARGWPGDLTLSVNISPVQFKDPLLAARILKLLAETGFPPNRLELEITESTLLEDRDVALTTVESLKNQGIRISLDDFGTGYASLTQLRSLPFDRIKIDKSFVSSLMDDQQSNAIVHAIATLGKSLRLPITAEGVETDAVHKRLQSLGCSDAQGYLFGRPLPAGATLDLLGGVPIESLAPDIQPIALALREVIPASKRRRTRGSARRR